MSYNDNSKYYLIDLSDNTLVCRSSDIDTIQQFANQLIDRNPGRAFIVTKAMYRIEYDACPN